MSKTVKTCRVCQEPTPEKFMAGPVCEFCADEEHTLTSSYDFHFTAIPQDYSKFDVESDHA